MVAGTLDERQILHFGHRDTRRIVRRLGTHYGAIRLEELRFPIARDREPMAHVREREEASRSGGSDERACRRRRTDLVDFSL